MNIILGVLALVAWVLIGWCTIFMVLLIHIIKAHIKGYNAMDWLSKNYADSLDSPYDVLRFIFGLIIWPIRLHQFCTDIPWLYQNYEML